MTNCKVIGWDIDETLTVPGSELTLAEEFSKKYDIYTTASIVPDDYRLHKRMGWSKEIERMFWDENYRTFLTYSKLKADALHTLYRLRDAGFKLVVITARAGDNGVTQEEVERLTEALLPSDLTIPIVYARDKLVPCLEHGVDLFIDDAYTVLKSLHGRVATAKMATPYNVEVPSTYTVESPSDILSILDGVSPK